MKRKVPSPPPPPLPPVKPRRAGAPKMTRSTGDDTISRREGGGRRGGGWGGEKTEISSRRRNNHHRKDSIPIPPPTHKYTTTNPSTMSPVYHLVYDLTSPPSPNYKQTETSILDKEHTGNNNNSVTASNTTSLRNVWSSTSLGLSKSGPTTGQNHGPPRFTSTSTHLQVQGGHRQVDLVAVGYKEGGLLDGLQVKTFASEKRERGERGEEESDTGITWEKPANVSSPPAPRPVHSAGHGARIREQNETISAVLVNGDSDRPPPLPPPRVPTIINANGYAADGTNWGTVTNNTGPFFHPHLPNNTIHKSHFSEPQHGYGANEHRLSYRSKKDFNSDSKNEFSNENRSNNNNQTLSHVTCDNTGATNIKIDGSRDDRGLRDGDRSQTFQQVAEVGDRDRADREARAEFSTIEAPSFLPPSLGQVARHELQTADATGISSSVAPSAGCVLVSGVSGVSLVNNSSRTLDGHSQVCFIGRGVGEEGCQVGAVTPAPGVRDRLLDLQSSDRSRPGVRWDTQQSEHSCGLDSGSVLTTPRILQHSGKNSRVRFVCDGNGDNSKPLYNGSKTNSRVSEDFNDIHNASDDLTPGRICVKDAVLLWDKPNGNNIEFSAADSEPEHCLKKAVFHRHGDSLRFFINHNDSGVVSDNEQSDGNNPPVSLESYVDPVTGKPIDWIISTDSKSAPKSNSKHAGIIAKVLDLTLSRSSGNTNSNKAPSLSLLSSISSSKASKASNAQQVHRPRPPVNRWDNIHVRTPQTHSVSRPSTQRHVNQTFQRQEDNTAPALPPRQPPSSSLSQQLLQQQQPQQLLEAVIVSPSSLAPSSQKSGCVGASRVSSNKAAATSGDLSEPIAASNVSRKFAFHENLVNQDRSNHSSRDDFSYEPKFNGRVNNTWCSPVTQDSIDLDGIHPNPNHSERLNHSHDGVLHYSEISSSSHVSGGLNISSDALGLNTTASSTSKVACSISGISDSVTYPEQNRSRTFVSSISFDSPEATQLRSYHQTVSSPLSPSTWRPQPDPVGVVTNSSHRNGVLTSANTERSNTRFDLEIVPAPIPRGYALDQCNDSAVDGNNPPPPPLPERGLSQHKNFSSSVSVAHKQKITREKPPQFSPAGLNHTDRDSTVSDHSKHWTQRGELISFDHLHKVDHLGDLPELTSRVEQRPDTEAVLSNSLVSRRTLNTLAGRTTVPSPSEDKLVYQHSLREECKKNQLWNLYGFDLKENHWIKERLSSNNNNAIGLQQIGQAEPFPGVYEAGQVTQSEQHKQPAKITPRQKFEILHSRVTEKVATNLRRHAKDPTDQEADELVEKNLNESRQACSALNAENSGKKSIASFNLVQFQNGVVYKESPRARFERDRAARVNAVCARENHGTSFHDAAESSLRLNRSCDELETETFGSRHGSNTNLVLTKASLPRSLSPSPDFGPTGQYLAPPIPSKLALCQRLQYGHLGSASARPDGYPSINTTDNGDTHYNSDGINHSSWNNSDKNRIPAAEAHSFVAAASRISESSIFAEQSKQGISSGVREPPVTNTNQCSEKSGLQSATHVDLTGDTSRRVAHTLPAKEISLPLSFQQHYVHSSHQCQSVPNSTGTGQWSGPVTSEPNKDKGGSETETRESLSDQQSASGPQSKAQKRGQYHRGLADAEILASDNRTSAGSLQAVDFCKDSPHLTEGSQPVSTSVSQTKRFLTAIENITTHLDPETQGQQSCAQTQPGSVSDPQASYRPYLSEPQKCPAVKKMSPGSVSSSGYESEINSATLKLNAFSDKRNENIRNKNAILSDTHTLSTVQQLRLRFGHNPDKGDSQFSANKNYSFRKHISETDANERKLEPHFNSLSLRPGETDPVDGSRLAGDFVQDYSDSRSSEHQKIQQYQLHQLESPARYHKVRHSSSSPRHNSKDETHSKRLLKKVNRSMHGIIHDLKPVNQGDNRRSPTRHYRSCHHKTHRRKGSRSSPNKSETGSGRTGSRSASASSECTICGEEAAAIDNYEIIDNQPLASKSDANNNLKATCDSSQNQNNLLGKNPNNRNTVFTTEADIDTYNINTEAHLKFNGKANPEAFRAKFFTREEAVMLAAKGLRIYESGEEYIAMRSPVKSPLHKSISAPQFGWEGAHYLIMPTVVEPFSPNIDSSTAYGITNLNLAMAASSSRTRSASDEDKDTGCNTNTLLTHRSISDSGASRRCSTSRFDNDLDASDFFAGHRSDGDDYGDEANGFNDINYNDDDNANNQDSSYLPMRERKLSARHRAMSVDVLYRERPERIQSDSEPLSPGRRHMMRRFFQPQTNVDKDRERAYVEWKTCSGWVGKMDMRRAQNGRNSRGYVEWDTIWTAATPWGAKEDDEHVYDVIAENSSTCSTEDAVTKETSKAGEEETSLKREKNVRDSVEMKLVTSVALDTPPALPERTYINKIKNTKPSDSNGNSSTSSASSATAHRHHHHHVHCKCKKHHHHHHHHHHNHSHNHHRYHNHHPHQQENHQQPFLPQKTPPQRPLKPSSLNISSKEQQMQQQSPSTPSPLSTPTKSKAPPSNKPPPKPPRHQLMSAQSTTSQIHVLQQQQPIATNALQHPADAVPLTTGASTGSGIATAAVSENYSEVHKLKGYKFTSLLTATESESPVPQLIDKHPPDPNAIYSETYWHLGPAVAPQAHAAVWQSGDVLDYIDGLHDSMSPKRRENIYILLNNKKTRAKFSESLEIESRLMSKGLLSPSPSSTTSAASSSPLPPSCVASASCSFPSFVMSRFSESSSVSTKSTEVTSFASPVSSPTVSKTGNMTCSALTTPTVIATTHHTRVIKRKGATAPVSSTYV